MCVQEAHKAFLDNDISCDIIKLDRIDAYDFLYLPYPCALSDGQVKQLAAWVNAGGTLIAEGGFAYFDENGKARRTMQSKALTEFFGCTLQEMSLAADRYNDLRLNVGKHKAFGGIYRQALAPTTGNVLGTYDNGDTACVENMVGIENQADAIAGSDGGRHPDRSPDESGPDVPARHCRPPRPSRP